MPDRLISHDAHEALTEGETLPYQGQSAAAECSDEHLYADPTVHQSVPNKEIARVRSGALALLVHLLLFAVLMLGVSWRSPERTPLVYVDLWSSLPGPSGLAGSGGPASGGQTRYPTAQATAPAGPATAPAGPAQSLPEQSMSSNLRPDIGVSSRENVPERKHGEEASPKGEGKRIAAKRPGGITSLRESPSKNSSAEVTGSGVGAGSGDGLGTGTGAGDVPSSHLAKIVALIRSNTYISPEVPGNAEVVYAVTLLPSGEVLDIQLVKSSGIPSYDGSAERAIRKSSPLPVPTDDPILFQTRYRLLVLHFRPAE